MNFTSGALSSKTLVSTAVLTKVVPQKPKAYVTMPISIVGRKSLALIN